jgi:Subtilisin inhibitor-like
MPTKRVARVARTTAFAGVLAAVAVIPSMPVSAAPHPTTPGSRVGTGARAGAAAPENELWLTVVRGENPDGPDRQWATLDCGPDGGTHPAPTRACTALRGVGGNIDALPATELMCSKIYAPVVAQALGHWNGTTVRYTKQFANRCELNARTGVVFAFGQ